MPDEDEAIEFQRIPTVAFGHEFTHIPEHVRQDIETLEREGVVYSDHWVDELDDFRHVRIRFTPDEAKDFARRTWDYELYLRAGLPTWARETPGISADTANDADSYFISLPDGGQMGPPYHCFAAFLGKHLENILCFSTPERTTIIDLQGKALLLFQISRAIRALTPTIRSFNKREKGLSPWPITCEDDVRDLLYVMLKPLIFDLTKEEPTPTDALTHKYVDLCSKASRILIELKWISKKNQWKQIVDQVRVDIQSYPTHDACETLLVAIVDSVRDIPDPKLLERELTHKQVIRGKEIDVRTYVVEP